MKRLMMVLIFSVVLFGNSINGFAQNAEIPPPADEREELNLMPVSSMNMPDELFPEASGRVSTNSVPDDRGNIPVMPVPGEDSGQMPVMPVPEASMDVPIMPVPDVETKTPDLSEEEHVDSHIIIESVFDPATSANVSLERHALGRMKNLVGRWEGSSHSAGEKQDSIAVVYELTAGGYAVLERIFPATAQEMITVFYENKGKLKMIHFSMMGTRSTMSLNPSWLDTAIGKEKVFEFELSPQEELNPVVDTHMHSMKMTFVDENHMIEEWTMYEAGNPSGSYTFNLTRVPAVE